MLSTTIIDTLSWHLALKQLLHALLRSFNLNLRRLTLDAVVSFFICSSQSRKSSKASLRQNKNIFLLIENNLQDPDQDLLAKDSGKKFFLLRVKKFQFVITWVDLCRHFGWEPGPFKNIIVIMHWRCRCLRLKYRQSLFHCYNHFLSPLMYGFGNEGWGIKVNSR